MGSTASQYFQGNLRLLHDMSYHPMLAGLRVRHGINWHTELAPSAYVIATAAVESHLNEMLRYPFTRHSLPTAQAWKFDLDWLDKLELRFKVMLVPELLFGRTFDRGVAPYQEFSLLVRVRNDFVHYKMPDAAPAYVATLERKAVALPRPHPNADYSWLDKFL